jgi:hypothetical protein
VTFSSFEPLHVHGPKLLPSLLHAFVPSLRSSQRQKTFAFGVQRLSADAPEDVPPEEDAPAEELALEDFPLLPPLLVDPAFVRLPSLWPDDSSPPLAQPIATSAPKARPERP